MKDVAETSNHGGGASRSRSTHTEIHQLCVDESKVHGLDGDIMSLERLLLHKYNDTSDDGFKAIGIVGTGGVGKTTLAQVIFNREQVKNYFLPRIWVCMSKEDTRTQMVERMLICLGVKDEIIESVSKKHGLPGLMFALHLQLKGKRYLIVLDDVCSTHQHKLDSCWLNDHQQQQYGGLPKGYGGTVILTTRSQEVAKKMIGEENNIYRLLPLTDPESCWSIFRDSVEKDGIINASNLEYLKHEVFHKCGGLPLAAKMIGQIMYQKLLLHGPSSIGIAATSVSS